MMRILVPLLIAIAVAIGAYYGTLLAIPYYATERTFASIGASSPLIPNVLRHSGLRFAGRDVVVRDNPDTTTSFAKYDLSEGPVRFIGSLPADRVYWSMSLFAHNTDNFFVLNDRDVEGLTPVVVIKRADQAYSPRPGEVVAVSPSTVGALIVRLVVPDRNDAAMVATLDAVLREGRIEPAGG